MHIIVKYVRITQIYVSKKNHLKLNAKLSYIYITKINVEGIPFMVILATMNVGMHNLSVKENLCSLDKLHVISREGEG